MARAPPAAPRVPTLRFVAVGGAAVGRRADRRRPALPACPPTRATACPKASSVQTLNLPGADRPGSVGRALPHARMRVAADGEVEIAGHADAGLRRRADDTPPGWWPTGDLGEIDADGFLHVRGRKKHVLITGVRAQRLARVGRDRAASRSRRSRRRSSSATARPRCLRCSGRRRADVTDAALDAAVAAGQRSAARLRPRRALGPRQRAVHRRQPAPATANGRPLRDGDRTHSRSGARSQHRTPGNPMSFH